MKGLELFNLYPSTKLVVLPQRRAVGRGAGRCQTACACGLQPGLSSLSLVPSAESCSSPTSNPNGSPLPCSGGCDGTQGMQCPLQQFMCAGISLATPVQHGWVLHHPSWPANLDFFGYGTGSSARFPWLLQVQGHSKGTGKTPLCGSPPDSNFLSGFDSGCDEVHELPCGTNVSAWKIFCSRGGGRPSAQPAC